MRRALIVAALFMLSVILYIDRACIAVAKTAIAADLGLDDGQMGMVFGAFALGYALAQVPAGWLADRFGTRLVLAAVVAGWSLMTGITGAVHTLAAMLVVRFVFGVGEAGAFPGTARVFYAWLPAGQRGRANGLVFSGSRLGAALAFPLLTWMLGRWGWRLSFVILGAVGALWAAGWALWYRDRAAPVEAPAATLPYRDVVRSRGLQLAMAQYFASNFTFFVGLTWMLPYLAQRFRLDGPSAARYAMVPLLVAAAAQWTAGLLVDGLHRRGLPAWSRRLPAMLGFALATVGMAAVPLADTPASVVACLSLAVFGADMTISPSWAYCVDLGGRGSGAVSGAMNMLGNLGAFASASAFPALLSATGSSAAYFWTAAALNAAAIGCWAGMKPPAAQPFI